MLNVAAVFAFINLALEWRTHLLGRILLASPYRNVSLSFLEFCEGFMILRFYWIAP